METKYLSGLIDRSFDATPEARKAVEESRKVTFVISSDAKDRHRTVLNMKGWKLDNYNRNPIVGYQHNVYGDNMCTAPNPDDVIGKSRVWLDDKDRLMGEVEFETADINPQAEKIFRKVLNGTLSATSVGFLEVGKGKTVEEKDANGRVTDTTYFFEGQELLEFSVVNIPSNPEATKKSLTNHTRAGVNFLRATGMKVADIRKAVNDLLDTIEEDEPKKESLGADPNSNKYKEYNQKRKALKK